jgi:hypothetical protein
MYVTLFALSCWVHTPHGSAFFVRQQDTTKHMNTSTIPKLTKTLRALTVLFASLGAFLIAAPLATVIGVTMGGAHIEGFGWQGYIRGSLIYLLAATVLFLCCRVSRRENRGTLATVLLWSVAIVTGAYAVFFVVGMLAQLWIVRLLELCPSHHHLLADAASFQR